jgi:hypothetical protein
MSNARDDHASAVALAGVELGELQTLMAMTREKAEYVVGAIVQAIGEEGPSTARNVLEQAGAVSRNLLEAAGMVDVAIRELQRYGSAL